MLDLDESLLQCVNPHEVNPIVGSTNKGTTEYRLNFNVANVDLATFYDTNRKVKLEEMEEFRDLSVFLPATPEMTSSNTLDELNTPVFDQEAFDFSLTPVKSNPFDYKFDQELFENLHTTPTNKDLTTDIRQPIQQGSSFINLSNNNQQNNELTNYINPPSGSSNGNVYLSDCESPPYEPLSHNNSLQSYADLTSGAICTPEDSNSSQTSPTSTMYLNINLNAIPPSSTINTPDILNTVADLDKTFNILDIVQPDEIRTVNVEDIFASYINTPSSTDSNIKTQLNKQSRRRRPVSYDTDDEYVPPTKSAKQIKEDYSSDSDSDYEQKPKRRGRTRKASSIASNDSHEPDGSKYRVIRDKNNEASRKSRLKRKQKEGEIEKECDGLVRRNLKLKAQVEELEKTVNSYRNNLFSIMLKK